MIDAHITTSEASPVKDDPFTASEDHTPFLGSEEGEKSDGIATLKHILWKAVLLVFGVSLVIAGFMMLV